MRPKLAGSFTFSSSDLPEDVREHHKDRLTYKGFDGAKFGFGKAEEFSLYEDEDGIITIPRRYAFEKIPLLAAKANSLLVGGEDVSFTFNEGKQSQRPDLKVRQDAAISAFMSNLDSMPYPFSGGILCAPCGTGKTVMACKMISLFSKTTLILVHKEFLADQWIERMVEFLDIREEDIGRVQAKKCVFEGKKVAIAMVQSLLDGSKYPQEFYEWPGVVMVDECHRMAAPQFQSAIPLFPAKVRVGLTATPKRGDGLQKVFEWHLGKILATLEGGNEIVPDVYQIPYKVWVPEGAYIWRDRKTKEIKKFFLAKLINLLAANHKRSRWIVGEVSKAVRAGRKVIIFSDRREHLEYMREHMNSVAKNVSTSYYVGGMKQEDLDRAAMADVIFSTFQMSKEGLDIPDIDTLFLTTPKSDVTQSVGRILRYHPEKKDPLVVDVVDTLPKCLDMAQKRLRQYIRLNYTVKKSVFD